MVGYICMCLHILTRTCSSFPGNFPRNVIIVTFRLSWIDFAPLAFLLTHAQTPSPDTGECVPVPCVYVCVSGRGVVWGGGRSRAGRAPERAAWGRQGQQGSSRSLALAPPLPSKQCAQTKITTTLIGGEHANQTFSLWRWQATQTLSAHRPEGTWWAWGKYEL